MCQFCGIFFLSDVEIGFLSLWIYFFSDISLNTIQMQGRVEWVTDFGPVLLTFKKYYDEKNEGGICFL